MESGSNCIFCTRQCPTSFTIVDGNPVKLKSERETENFLPNPENAGDGSRNDSSIESQLKVIFILRKILNIEEETCSKFLAMFDGKLHPEFWISVCSSCNQLVIEFWEKLREIGKLERRLKWIREELTGFVQNTRAFPGRKAAGNGPTWDEIRRKAVDDFTTDASEYFHFRNDEDNNDEDDHDHLSTSHHDSDADDTDFQVPNKVEVGHSISDEHLNQDNSISFNPNESDPPQQKISSLPPKKPCQRKYYLKCSECGHLSVNMLRFKLHSNLHKLNKGVICQDCGWLCDNLSTHVGQWHAQTSGRLTMEQKLANREIRLMNPISDDIPEENGGLEVDLDAYQVVRRGRKANIFRCKLCSATHQKRKGIQKHLAGHKNGIPCKECGWVIEKSKMTFHVAQWHVRKKDSNWNKRKKEKPQKSFRYECSDCPAFYFDSRSFQEHRKLHESGTFATCKDCGWCVPLGTMAMGSHKAQRHPKTTIRTKVERGNVVVSEDIPYYCDHCHMISPSLSRFLTHRKNNHGNEPFVECKDCKSQFESQQLLKLHLAREHGHMEEIPEEETQPQQCQYCSEEFPSKMKKDLHVAKAHLDKLLSCETCNASFTSFSDFRRHIETTLAHANQKRFTCELCGRGFSCSWKLKRHREKEHYEELGLEPHRCSPCGKVFANKAVLDRHIQDVHSPETHICHHCGNTFTTDRYLKRHVEYYHPTPAQLENWVKCPKCEKAFCKKHLMKQHLLNCRA